MCGMFSFELHLYMGCTRELEIVLNEKSIDLYQEYDKSYKNLITFYEVKNKVYIGKPMLFSSTGMVSLLGWY